MKLIQQQGIRWVAWLMLFSMCSSFAWANQQVSRKGQRLAPERIRAAVRQHIARHAPWDTEQMRISKIHFNRPLYVPSGKAGFQVTAPKHTDWLGAVGFSVAVMVNGKKAAAVTVPVKIEVWSDVILTTKPLGKYQPIGQGDVQVKKMDLARVPSNVIVDIEQVVGSRTNRRIAANCLLRQDHVEMPPAVKRGDLVSVVAESAHLKISIKGMAKEDGRLGERIKVVNLRSKKAVYALVVKDHTVRVDF